jgi:hypothetical protein
MRDNSGYENILFATLIFLFSFVEYRREKCVTQNEIVKFYLWNLVSKDSHMVIKSFILSRKVGSKRLYLFTRYLC